LASIHSVYVDGLAAVLDRFEAPPDRFLYISSTGVYGDVTGDIDEQSPCHPTREGGRACLAAEQLLAAHRAGTGRVILRLAGIYGPGRLPRRADLVAGRPIEAAPHGQLNLIHVDDAADVVLAAETRARPPALYVVSDGHPVERADYYRYAAELLETPAPVFAPPGGGSSRAERATGPRHLHNDKMRRELAVTLRYPTYREGLRAALV
jgi:nucleoside-diphosphate-sugar epimerase